MATALVSINELRKRYGTIEALKGVSFDVPKGQVVGFLGPNGAGKTTTMRILAGFLNATSGTARVSGLDMTDHSVAARRLIGYLPENNPLYEEMMVVDLLRFIAEVRGVPRPQWRPRITAAVERCGLTEVLGKDIGQLSKGFKQRVGLAQAILHDPDLLILDEPTNGLDPNQIVEIRALIRELGQQKTIILSTHILSEVQAMCSRVLIINDGRLVADDSPQHLAAGADAVLQVLIRPRGQTADAIEVGLRAVPGVVSVAQLPTDEALALTFSVRYGATDIREAVWDSSVKGGWCILEVSRASVTLEDTFRKLTQDTKEAA